MDSQAMKRDDEGSVSAALAQHVAPLQVFHMRQTRRGWLQECLGCEAKTEFKYFKGPPELTSLEEVNDPNQLTHIATSLDDSTFLCRLCFPAVARTYMNTLADLVVPFLTCRCLSLVLRSVPCGSKRAQYWRGNVDY
jgi:hypothetical protein